MENMVYQLLSFLPMKYFSFRAPHFSRLLARRTRGKQEDAFTLVESGMATMMVATVVGALFLGNSRVLQMVRVQRETIAATQSFQERMEKIRGTPFTQI